MAEDSALGGLADLVSPVSLGLGVLQTGLGIIQSIGAKKRQRKLLAQRKAYQTPDEIFDILNATKANAQSGYDATTLNYLTGQTDQAFSSGIGAINRMGGDPNDLSALFSQKLNGIMKIGAESHAQNMANFTQYLSALGDVASNRAAEQKSQQDLIKDRLQAEGANLQSASGNISGGINSILSTLSAAQIAQLYTEKKKKEAGASLYSIDSPPLMATSASNILSGGSLAPMSNYQ